MSLILILNTCILVSLLCWGSWGIFDKLALKHAPTPVIMASLFASTVPVALITFVYLNIMCPGWVLTPEVLLWSGLGFATYSLAMFCYLGAMSLTEASFVLGVTASYPVVLQFLSAHFLGEPLVPARLIGSILVAIGVAAIGFSRPAGVVRENRKSPLLWVFIVAATLLWGVWGIFDKKAVDAGGPGVSFLGHCVWEIMVLVPFGWWVWKRYRAFFNKGKQLWKPIAASAVCINIGSLSYLTALSLATASYVLVITGCYPMVMYLLAIGILKEQFNMVRLVGIILVTIGGIVTQTTQGM